MIRRPPRSTRTDTLFPYTTLFRSPITVATATLTEGVNLPFDLIFLTSLKRRSWDQVAEQQVVTPLPTSEIRNLAGRAGRPGAAKGIEGMTLVAIPTREAATAPKTIPVQRQQRAEPQRDYDRTRQAGTEQHTTELRSQMPTTQ